MKLDTITVEQFNGICNDNSEIGDLIINTKNYEFANDTDNVGYHIVGLFHTMIYCALANYYDNNKTDDFWEAYDLFSDLSI